MSALKNVIVLVSYVTILMFFLLTQSGIFR